MLDQAPLPLVPYIREADYAVRPPWRGGERKLLDYLLIAIQEGELTVTLFGQCQRFHAGELCLIQPDQRVALQGMTATITPFIHFDLFYNPLRADSFPTRAGQLDLTAYRHLLQPTIAAMTSWDVPLRLQAPDPLMLQRAVVQVIGRWQSQTLIDVLEAHSQLSTIMLTILKAYAGIPRLPAHHPPALNWITSYLSLHLAEPLSLADMAARARLSPSRFAAVFRQHMGISPHQYLLQMRIQHAQELLRTTTSSLAQIAAYCGFSSTQHFARVFRQHTGWSPTTFRKSADATPLSSE